MQNFMMGRYGSDPLNLGILVLSIVLGFIPFWPVKILSFALIALAFFRMFSKNVARRRKENAVFMKVWLPVFHWFRRLLGKDPASRAKQAQKANYRFFKCPKCRQEVRVPKGKGKLRITCPKCGEKFEKKT